MFLEVRSRYDLLVCKLYALWHDNKLIIIIIGAMYHRNTFTSKCYKWRIYTHDIRIKLFPIWGHRVWNKPVIKLILPSKFMMF